MKRMTALLLALLLLFAIGCAPAVNEEQQPEATANGENATDDTNHPMGGDIVVATTLTTNTMSPFEIRGASVYAELLYESLLRLDEEGVPQPYLAETFEEDIDSLTYTIKLREGILFHDGSELTAEVAKWNLDTYKERGVLSSSFLSKLESVEVTDEYTIVLHMSEWDAFLPYALARPLGCGYMVSKEAYEKDGVDTVSTGPFKLDSWEQGVYTKVVKFEDYWQGEPYLDSVTLQVFASTVVAQASLETGEIDAIFNTDYDSTSYLASEGYTVYTTAIPASNHTICFHCVNEEDPFSNLLVRQAVCYAIDREVIADALFAGYGEASTQYGAPGSMYYNEDVTGYEYDAEKAKQLLAEAGYPDGFSTTLTAFSVPLWMDICQVVVEQLAEVGITVEINVVDGAGYAVAVDGWGGGMLFHPMGMDNGAASQIAANFVQGLESGLGVSSFIHPDDLNAKIQEACVSETAEATEMFKEVQKMIFEDYCLLKSIGVTYSTTVVNPDLIDSGLGAITSSSHTLWKAYLAG